jgi:L-threonylcarbamoyladenylate synthase
MDTERLRVDPSRMHEPDTQLALSRAAAILRRGGTVALPTETVYGLGANALDATAVEAIFTAKGRPHWDPLIVHVSDEAMLAQVVREIPEAAQELIAKFWPGPLTLLLPRSSAVSDTVTAGRPLVAVRMPAHPVARELIRLAGVPIAAPSANRFGHTSPTTADHVLDDLDGLIDAVVDSGPAAYGVESTVLDPGPTPMIVYRPGAITLEQICEAAGDAVLFSEPETLSLEPREAMPSPGVGPRHYAPRAKLILVEEKDCKKGDMAWGVEGNAHIFSNERVGIMLPEDLPGWHSEEEARDHLNFAEIFPWGKWANREELAHNLFAGLRELDAKGCTVIVCPVPSGPGIAAAIRDRLRKAVAPD